MSDQQPLITLDSLGHRLEVYAEQVRIVRTDVLAAVLPTGFSDPHTATYDQIVRVNLIEPEHLRLDDCERDCLQLVITCRDHHTLSFTLQASQREAAQSIRAYIEQHLTRAGDTR